MEKKGAKVCIVMGSDSDLPVMDEAAAVLKEFGVEHEKVIASAHRSPGRTAELARGAEKRGIKVIIAGAGYSAHLAGVVAAHTTLPVIGVPLSNSPLQGVDALLAMGQMPSGIPVATVTIGKAGAKNAAILAVEILALSDEALKNKLNKYRENMVEGIARKDKSV